MDSDPNVKKQNGKNKFLLEMHRKKIILTLISMIFLLMLVSLIPFGNSIALKEPEGDMLTKIPINQGKTFEIAYRTRERNLAVERYGIDTADRRLYHISSWFEKESSDLEEMLGPGIKTREDRGMIRVDFQKNLIKQIEYRAIGMEDHVLSYGQTKIKLFEEWDCQRVDISIERINLFEYAKYIIRYRD